MRKRARPESFPPVHKSDRSSRVVPRAVSGYNGALAADVFPEILWHRDREFNRRLWLQRAIHVMTGYPDDLAVLIVKGCEYVSYIHRLTTLVRDLGRECWGRAGIELLVLDLN